LFSTFVTIHLDIFESVNYECLKPEFSSKGFEKSISADYEG